MLGKYRLPAMVVVAVVAIVASWIMGAGFVRGIVLGLVAFALAWVGTTEFALKASLSIVGGLVSGALAGLVLAVLSPGLGVLVGFITALVVMVIAYTKLDKSAWIGSPCPHCHARGSVDITEIGKDYLGQKLVRKSSTTMDRMARDKLYNLYRVTSQHTCGKCGQQWTSTSETRESA